ncbi:MAG: hemerythrin domain-containing protein [Marmoricola sp.]
MTTDVVDLILQDHRELERMFDQLSQSPERRAALIPLMTTLLFAHSRAEEGEVYPAAREAGAREDVEHSQQEHLAADQLAARLGGTDPDSPAFDDVLRELVDAVRHHLEEEEETVLADMREMMSPEQLSELAEAFLTARAHHLGGQQDDLTRAEMQQQAANVGMEGASQLSKKQLGDALSKEAEL